MDIIIDTNILYKAPHLRSLKSQAVWGYLEKTNSHLIIPAVVREEIIALYRRNLEELRQQVRDTAKKIDHWCSSDISQIEVHLDIDKEVSAYESYIHNLTHGGGALELPYRDEFLGEVIRRLVKRVKPASEKGEEFRDVVIWLSIKEFLRQSKREAAFISQDTNQFAAKDSRELHPDLTAELLAEDLHLRYFCSLDDFIQQQSRKVEFITKEWIENNISQADIERVSSRVIESNERSWHRYTERKGLDWTGYIGFIDFTFIELNDFYVYELSEDNFYSHASYYGEVEVELECEESHRGLRRGIELKLSTVEVYLEVECKIKDQKAYDLSLESWDFA